MIMTQWTDEDPGAGDTGVVATASSTLTELAGKVDTVVTSLGTTASGVGGGVWTGSAADGWSTSLTTLASELAPVKSAYTTAATALAAYVSTVDDIRARAVPLRLRLSTAQSAQNKTYMDGSEGPTPAQQDQRDQDKQDAIREETYVRGELEALAEERRTADTALQTALTNAVPTTWPAQQAALAAVGIDSVADATPRAVAQAMADLASKIANGNNTDPDDVQKLTDLLTLYGDDQSVMAQMMLALGGTDLVTLIDRLGDDAINNKLDVGAAAALAVLLRSGLSTGSADWTDATGSRFADQMFESASYSGGGGIAAIGFLFGDAANAPVGETTAYAAAVIMDDWERKDYNGSTVDQSMAGASYLSLYMDEANGLRVIDAAGRIFETLGEYPDSAHEFLTDTTIENGTDSGPTVGQNRIQYWYGERDWSNADGFAGPGALWAGAQRILGGPADPSGAYDAEAWTSAADLSSRAMNALAENPSYLSENVTELGAVHLAEAFLPQMQGIVEMPVLDDDYRGADAPGTVMVDLRGSGTERAAAIISQQNLAEFLAGLGEKDGAAVILRDAASSYRDVLIAEAAGEGTPGAMYDAIRRNDALTAIFDGSDLGAGIGETVRTDKAVSDAVDGAKELVGLIPIPGASEVLFKGGNVALDWGQGKVEGWLTDQGGSALERILGGGQTDAVRASAALDAEGRSDMLTFANLEIMYALAEPDGGWQDIPEPPRFTPEAGWSTERYDAEFADFQTEAKAWSEAHTPQLDEAYQEATGSDESVSELETRYEPLRDKFATWAEGN
jgi:hypothetical protein